MSAPQRAVLAALLALAAGCGQAIVGAECLEGLTACGHECVDVENDPEHCGSCERACGDGSLCERGECVDPCGPGLTLCGEECVDTSADPDHCGGCWLVCGVGSVCTSGSCESECPTGTVQCGRSCVDTSSDPDHCGGCERACEPDEVCHEGECVDECPLPFLECDGVCVDVFSDPAHCGRCGRECEEGEVCFAGECVDSCPPPLAPCGNLCVDLSRDPDHCGWCFHPCAPGESCVEGRCVEACPPGETRCGDECVETSSDERHCGGCDHACAEGEVCDGGSCYVPCAIDEIRCAGECVDPMTDPDNCGGCGTVCGPDELCALGSCVLDCPEGLVPCGRICTDTTRDPHNCGACGVRCRTGLCSEGSCLDADVGHLVLIGHSYDVAFRVHEQLLGNAVFLRTVGGGPAGEMRVLLYDEHAPTGAGTAAHVVDEAIDEVSRSTGRAWIREVLSDATLLPAVIVDHDVLIVYEQSLATDAELAALGAGWASTLGDFVRVGGVVVVVDGGQGNDGTWQIVDAAGLARIDGVLGDETGGVADVVRPADAIARDLPVTYYCADRTVTYDTAEPDVVVSVDGRPLALHLTFAP